MLSHGKYIELIKGLRIDMALDSLKPGAEQRTEFHYGYVCGIQAGLDLALSKLEAENQDDQEEVGGKNPTTRKR
jgi:hypothetical protein